MSDTATAEATTEAAPAADATLVTGASTSEAPNAETTTTTEAGSETEAGQVAEKAAEGETEQKGEEKPESETEQKPEGAPEEYAEFAMPEGVTLDTELTDKFKTVAKDLNLTQEQAQKVVELGAEMRQRDAQAIVDIRAGWIEETKADKEIGGDNLDQTLSVARKAVDAYASPAFKDLLNQSGLGNHPEVVRFMAKVGKTVAEDQVVTGGDRTSTPNQSLAQRLYGTPKE